MSTRILRGIPVSTGIAIGQAYSLNKCHFSGITRQTVREADVPAELERLADAFASACQDLERILTLVPEDLHEHAAIIELHLMILRDPKFRKRSQDHVRSTRINAEWGLERAVGDVEEIFAAISDEYLRQRGQDIRVVAERVLAKLVGRQTGLHAITQRAILLANDLTPADTIELEINKIMAFATAQGGRPPMPVFWPGLCKFLLLLVWKAWVMTCLTGRLLFWTGFMGGSFWSLMKRNWPDIQNCSPNLIAIRLRSCVPAICRQKPLTDTDLRFWPILSCLKRWWLSMTMGEKGLVCIGPNTVI